MSSSGRSQKLPKKISADDYLHRQGVDEFGEIVTKTSSESYSKAEARSRLKLAEAEADMEQRITYLNFLVKQVAVNIVGLILIVILTTVSVSILISDSSSPDEERWAQAALSGILGAMAGFVFGKSGK